MTHHRTWLIGIGFVFGLASLSVAYAAQNGRVIPDAASIRQNPDPGSPSLAELKRGTVLRLGNQPQNGWYKVLVPGKKAVGWINEADVDTQAVAPLPSGDRSNAYANKNKKAAHKDSSAFVQVFGTMHFVSGVDTTAATGSSVTAPTFGAELGFKLSPQFTLGAYLATFSFTSTDATGYTAKGTMIGAMGELEFVSKPAFTLSGGLGAGLSTGMTAGVKIASVAKTSETFSAPFILIQMAARFQLGTGFWGVGLLGYKSLSKKAVPLTSTSSIDLNLSSPYLGLGLQLDF